MEAVAVGEVKSPMVVALDIDCAGQEREEFIRAWAAGLLEWAQMEDIDTDNPNFVLLSLSLSACGGHATYRAVDDIPLVDVPCPCGNPDHWLIKYSAGD